MESTAGTDDNETIGLIELSDWSQTSDISEVPETPPQMIVHHLSDSEDDDIEDMEEMFGLNRMPDCLLPMSSSSLRSDCKHHVLYRVPIEGLMTLVPKPYPDTYSDKWDSRHVKMPNSPHNQITAVQTVDDREVKTQLCKWELIQENLLSDIKSFEQLEEAIKTYNPFMERHGFDVLYEFFNDNCTEEERKQFFDDILPQMIQLALRLPQIVTQSVPLLRQRHNSTLFLSQEQIACLLANAFFCTFPKRSEFNKEYKTYPIINFLGLFSSFGSSKYSKSNTKIEKLKCFVNYFRRVTKEMPKGVVSFERRSLMEEEVPVWHNSNKSIHKLVVLKNGFIETEGEGLLQVDFANRFLGGGVLRKGCVQEEIRFAICPELLISRLFTEELLNNEAVIISGCEQFSTYSGYANTFEWTNDYKDNTSYDEWGRRLTRVVAIDAIRFESRQKLTQYETQRFERELNKAFSGFLDRRDCDPKHKCGIASGNWGCGAYNGDPNLKAIIQLMAASQADRDLVYFTFNDNELKKQISHKLGDQ